MSPRTESGATLVEAAISLVVVFALLFMVVEGAFFGRAYLSARDAASSGARAGAVGASNADADYDILQGVARSTGTLSTSSVVSVVVYNPQGASQSMPAGCTSGPVAGMCNYYAAADLHRPQSDFAGGTRFAGSSSWPAAGRSTSITTGLGHVGVYVKVNVGGLVGPLPATVSADDVVEIEPHS